MANALYTKGKEGLLGGDFALDTDDMRTVLVDGDDYTENLSTDNALDDVPTGSRVATMGSTMTSLAITDGVFDAADVTYTSVTGDQSELLVIYYHTGTESTSLLLVYIDTASGLPVTPNGGDITVTWDSGANKIFAL